MSALQSEEDSVYKKPQIKQKSIRYWLEDVSGRIELRQAEGKEKREGVGEGSSLVPISTGAVVGIYGNADIHGVFVVKGWSLAGYPPFPI